MKWREWTIYPVLCAKFIYMCESQIHSTEDDKNIMPPDLPFRIFNGVDTDDVEDTKDNGVVALVKNSFS